MKFVKRPIVIDAIQWNGGANSWNEVQNFAGKAVVPFVMTDSRITIHTLEGDMICYPSDWIVKGVKNEFYPVRKDIFEETYAPVSDL